MHPLLLVGGAVAIGAVAKRVYRRNADRLERARVTMTRAVEAEGLELLNGDLSWLPVGPFATSIARHAPVYRVVARDAAGIRRSGWVHCPDVGAAEVVWEA